MAPLETGVSYYGITHPGHARRDFDEMAAHNCNAVILALSEFDIDFWLPSIRETAREARRAGLKCYLDTWGVGKWFGGEPPSKFLSDHAGFRQVSALTGEALPAACFNTEAFRQYFYSLCDKLAHEVESDGFFWDEPHYALPKSYASITGGPGDDWSCRCSSCRAKYEALYRAEMPKILSPEVIRFRQDQALEILSEASRRIKIVRPDSRITCCVHATLNSYYVCENRGYDDWDKVASCPYFDVFSTTIISPNLPQRFSREVTGRTLAAAKKHGKSSQRWVMGYYQEPEDLEDVGRTIRSYAESGVESIFAWTYRGGYGTVLAAPRALELWEVIGRAYGEARKAADRREPRSAAAPVAVIRPQAAVAR